jgi:hypothetical protein
LGSSWAIPIPFFKLEPTKVYYPLIFCKIRDFRLLAISPTLNFVAFKIVIISSFHWQFFYFDFFGGFVEQSEPSKILINALGTSINYVTLYGGGDQRFVTNLFENLGISRVLLGV